MDIVTSVIILRFLRKNLSKTRPFCSKNRIWVDFFDRNDYNIDVKQNQPLKEKRTQKCQK